MLSRLYELKKRYDFLALSALVFILWYAPYTLVNVTTNDDAFFRLFIYDWQSFWNETKRYVEVTGRPGMYLFSLLGLTPYAIDSEIYFQIAKALGVFLAFASFAYLIKNATQSKILAYLAFLLGFLLYPHNSDHDPLTSYPFTFMFMVTCFHLSLSIFLQKKRSSLIVVTLHAIPLICYESYLPMVGAHFLIALLHFSNPEDKWKVRFARALKKTSPLITLTLFWFAYLLYFRQLFPSHYQGTQISFEWGKAIKILMTYSFATFPGMLIANFKSFFQWIQLSSPILAGPIISLLLAIGGIFTLVAKGRSATLSHIHNATLFVCMLFLPQLVITTSKKYQIWIDGPSNFYVTSLNSHFALIALIVIGLSYLRQKLGLQRKNIFTFLSAAGLLIAALVQTQMSLKTLAWQIESSQKWRYVDQTLEKDKDIESQEYIIYAPALSKNFGIVHLDLNYWQRYIERKYAKKAHLTLSLAELESLHLKKPKAKKIYLVGPKMSSKEFKTSTQ